MKDPNKALKETTGRAAVKGAEASAPEYCHGSVCLGNQKPTHCICPTEKK